MRHNESEMEFDIVGIHPGLANAFRRILLSEVNISFKLGYYQISDDLRMSFIFLNKYLEIRWFTNLCVFLACLSIH